MDEFQEERFNNAIDGVRSHLEEAIKDLDKFDASDFVSAGHLRYAQSSMATAGRELVELLVNMYLSTTPPA